MPGKANDKTENLTLTASVELLRGAPEDAPEASAAITGFDLSAYTGAVVERLWGRLVIALDGITASQQMPVFLGHDQDRIVGYAQRAGNEDGAFRVRGVFSQHTDAAREVMALAAEGFPWQASIGVSPRAIHELPTGAVMEVNGRQITGPIDVWTASEVFETSFVPLGADSTTSATVFERQEPAQPISQEQHMDLETLKKEHPELVQAVAAETLASLTAETLKTSCPELAAGLLAAGAEQERNRIAEVREQCIPGHEALIARLELDGKSTGADAAKAIVAAEKAARLQAAASLAQTGNPPVPMAGDPESGTGRTMKREAFNRLGDRARREALDAGVAIVE